MSKIVIANWKSHPATADEAMVLAKASDVPGLIIAPGTAYLPIVAKLLQYARLASQNFETVAPYTIIGHSDYRASGETDEGVAQKIKSALEKKITPILCVGESRVEHDAGRAREFVKSQLEKDLSGFHVSRFTFHDVLIAYEPLWSISTTPGATPDTPQSANDMIQYIKNELSKSFPVSHSPCHIRHVTFRVLYGGSVNETNAESFLAQPAIDGLLVGAASLRPESIKKIVEIACRK